MNGWLEGLSAYLETFGLHQTMQTVEWAVPALQTIHILAIGVVFSSSLVVALRVAHISGIEWSPARWGKRLDRWVFTALAVLLVSGAVLIIGEPARSLLSPMFQIKIPLVIVAAILVWVLGHRLQRLDPPHRATGTEKLLAILIVLLWIAVISAGRWIAYYTI
ncbi:MAG: conserved hypothetical rane protein [Sphingomonas bacterium]|nr:conserved hypothetical rane protein [Sphingomonas bacterium]